MYVAREYEKLIPQEDKYKKELVKLPKPEFITLYNGTEKFPKEKTLRLSDAFIVEDGMNYSLELEVKVININPSAKHEILTHCDILAQYSHFVDITRQYANDGSRLKKAIEQCISQGILTDYLIERGSEVMNMLVSEYNYEMDIAVQRAESEARGLIRGRDNKGIQVFLNCKNRGMSTEEAQAIADISDELVRVALGQK
jgi:hypothetical protein